MENTQGTQGELSSLESNELAAQQTTNRWLYFCNTGLSSSTDCIGAQYQQAFKGTQTWGDRPIASSYKMSALAQMGVHKNPDDMLNQSEFFPDPAPPPISATSEPNITNTMPIESSWAAHFRSIITSMYLWRLMVNNARRVYHASVRQTVRCSADMWSLHMLQMYMYICIHCTLYGLQ